MFASDSHQPRLQEQHSQARNLRREGRPIKSIARQLGVSVSSVSVWTRDIELSAEQREANRLRGVEVRASQCRERNRAKRLAFQEEGRRRARLHDQLHAMGCMLYWAEGGKGRNCLVFANSDPAMMQLFRRFATECFGVADDRFALRLNVYTSNALTIGEIEQYWLALLRLPPECLRKHALDHHPTSSSGSRVNKLPYGVCTLRVLRSTAILQHIYGAIQEYGGFEEPRWLDGLY